jgi:hypothetical protein
VKPQYMLSEGIVACRSCCRRGTSTCRLHALLLACAAAGEASAQAACMAGSWQELFVSCVTARGRSQLSFRSRAPLYGSKGAYNEAEPLTQEALRIM